MDENVLELLWEQVYVSNFSFSYDDWTCIFPSIESSFSHIFSSHIVPYKQLKMKLHVKNLHQLNYEELVRLYRLVSTNRVTVRDQTVELKPSMLFNRITCVLTSAELDNYLS